MGDGGGAIRRAILPNAGLPQRIEGQFVYAAGPDYLGRMVERHARRWRGGRRRLLRDDAGAHRRDARRDRCAGRRASRAGVARRPRRAAAPTSAASTTIRAEVAADTDTPAPPSRLARALADGRYVISVEIDPPRSVRIERTIEAARMLQDAGVDIVNVSDSAMARVRMGALAVAFGIQHDLDLECVVHFTTRDRNLMALESELLGAHALGVRDILALTGDPPRIGDLPGATGVWDVDSIGLVEILARLNRGEDAAGSPIGQPADVHDRLRARPDGRRRRHRMGSAGAQDRRRRAPDHDPAAVFGGAGRGDVRARRAGASDRPASRSRCCSACCRSSRRATPSSSTTRCPGSPSRTRRGRAARGRRARRGGRAADHRGAAGGRRRPGRRDLRHALVRALRAGAPSSSAGCVRPSRSSLTGTSRRTAANRLTSCRRGSSWMSIPARTTRSR